MSEDKNLPVEVIPMTVSALTRQVELIGQVQREVMKADRHYGRIPGTPKPTLLKPGAELLCLTFRLCPDYIITDKTESPEFLSYIVKCTLTGIENGYKVATGIGSCNSGEKKYGAQIASRKVSPYELQNTLIKMAEKRALIAAILNACAASDYFTQDLEDLPEAARSPEIGPNSPPEARKAPAPKTDTPKEESPPEAATTPNKEWLSMKAKYAGKCGLCEEPISEGDAIYWLKGTKNVRHKGCHELKHKQEPESSEF